MSATKARPLGLTLTAWFWIVVGALMLLGALMGGFAFFMMRQMAAAQPLPPDTPAGFRFMFDYFGLFVVVQIAVAALAIAAGISLLKLRAWARTALEAISWLGLLYIVGFGTFWVYSWIAMTGEMPRQGAPIDVGTFQVFGAVMGTIVSLIFAAPLVLVVYFLRGAEAKAAIAAASAASDPR